MCIQIELREMHALLLGETKSIRAKRHLREAEGRTGQPGRGDHETSSVVDVAHGQRAQNGEVAVQADAHDHKSREKEAEGAEEGHESTQQVAPFPRYGDRPSNLHYSRTYSCRKFSFNII